MSGQFHMQTKFIKLGTLFRCNDCFGYIVNAYNEDIALDHDIKADQICCCADNSYLSPNESYSSTRHVETTVSEVSSTTVGFVNNFV